MKQGMRYFDEWLRRKLRDPKFRRGYPEARLAVRLGYRIHQLRKRLGLTQAQLAARMGTKQQAIARLERGDYEGFTLKTLERIAEATKTELVIDFRRTGT
ncbi:MAG: helix-turn-helix transcriptional regulator [Planctomycetes bacterium]|nr:helix-turn-helix transcriptional regulator [Planctomycetota bacterium]